MKKFALCAILALSTTVFADNMLNYFKAVTGSEALQQLVTQAEKDDWALSQINHAETYRCPGCFVFKVSFMKYDLASRKNILQKQKLATNLDPQTQQITVTHVD